MKIKLSLIVLFFFYAGIVSAQENLKAYCTAISKVKTEEYLKYKAHYDWIQSIAEDIDRTGKDLLSVYSEEDKALFEAVYKFSDLTPEEKEKISKELFQKLKKKSKIRITDSSVFKKPKPIYKEKRNVKSGLTTGNVFFDESHFIITLCKDTVCLTKRLDRGDWNSWNSETSVNSEIQRRGNAGLISSDALEVFLTKPDETNYLISALPYKCLGDEGKKKIKESSPLRIVEADEEEFYGFSVCSNTTLESLANTGFYEKDNDAPYTGRNGVGYALNYELSISGNPTVQKGLNYITCGSCRLTLKNKTLEDHVIRSRNIINPDYAFSESNDYVSSWVLFAFEKDPFLKELTCNLNDLDNSSRWKEDWSGSKRTVKDIKDLLEKAVNRSESCKIEIRSLPEPEDCVKGKPSISQKNTNEAASKTAVVTDSKSVKDISKSKERFRNSSKAKTTDHEVVK